MVRIDRPVFMSGGALELSLISSSSARDLQHWTWRLQCCFARTGHQHDLDIRSTCFCTCAFFTMFWSLRSGNGTCCAVWRCSGTVSLGMHLCWHLYCCCETSVICCTFWPVLLMYCTCGNFNSLCTLWVSFLCKQNLGNLDLLGHLIHYFG